MKLRKGSFSAVVATSSGVKPVAIQSGVTIGDVSITSSKNITESVPAAFEVLYSGNAKDVRYTWSTSPATSIISDVNSGSTDITFTADGVYTIFCTLESDTATDSPVTESIVRSVQAVPSEPLNVGSSFSPSTGTWETFADLASAVSGASAGSTVDLGGRGFCITGAWTNDKLDKGYEFTGDGFKIKNGYFRGAKQIPSGDWTVCNDGQTYYASLPYTRDASLDDDFRFYLIDDSVSTPPRYSITIPNKWSAELDLDQYRFMAHSDMILVQGDTESFLVINADNNNRVERIVLVEQSHVDYVNQYLIEMDDITDAQLLVLSGPNVVGVDRVVSWGSWTDVDGEAGPAGEVYDNVLTVSMDGPTGNQGYYAFTLVNVEIRNNPADVSIASPGEYIVDNKNGRVYYYPTAGLSKVFLPVASSVIKTASVTPETNFVFEECTFDGNAISRTGNTPYLLEVELAVDKERTDVKSCHFKNGVGSTQVMNIDRCLFERAIDAHVIIGSGAQITNSKFLTTEGRSDISLRYADTTLYSSLPRTVIANCYIQSKSAHGQGISLYQGSWKNSTVRHCIFDTCFRAMSFQKNPKPETPEPVDSRMLVENNLFYWPIDAEVDLFKGGGQAFVSYNGGDYEYASSNAVVKFRYNTFASVLAGSGLLVDDVNIRYMTFDLADMISADVEIVGNIAAGKRTPGTTDAADGIFNPGHAHFDNLFFTVPGPTPGGQFACSNLDYGIFGSSYEPVDVFDMTTCSPTISTPTASLTPSGIRWTARPNLSAGDVSEAIDIDWYLTWAEDTIPSTPAYPTDPTELGKLYVHKKDDERTPA